MFFTEFSFNDRQNLIGIFELKFIYIFLGNYGSSQDTVSWERS